MSRLTDKRFAKSGFVAISNEERKTLYIPTLEEVYAKLAEYEDLEEQGRLIKLPCKIGDKVYQIKPSVREGYTIIEWSIRYFECYAAEIHFCDLPYMHFAYANNIGKTVFFTRKEAEAALKKIKEKINEEDNKNAEKNKA